jgi:methylmalonyl-CoA mutase N-terminal domain/subunit
MSRKDPEETRRQLRAACREYEARVREILAASGDEEQEARTQSGLPLKPLYTPLDVEGTDYLRDLGFPGSYPFTRGVFPAGHRLREWTRRQVVGLGTAEETNRRLKRLFAEGQTGFSVCGMGYQSYDSDDERSLGHLGRGGVWIDTLADMETLLDGIDMEAISLNQIGASIPVFAMLLAVAERRGIPWDRLRGTIQNWAVPGGEGPELRGNGSIDIIEFCATHMPRWNHTSISVRNTRDSGATAPQEIAFGLYQGAFSVRAARARGLDVDAFAPRLSFFLSAESDFLEEVAKFRAMRRMWAGLMRERFRARDPRSWTMRFHVQTSALSLTAQEPLMNLIRSALHALAAVLGGAHSMSVNSFDEALAIPTELSATLSLRTQEIILHESGVAKVIDPLGGSYCVEALTRQLEDEAGKLLEKLEAMEPFAAFRWMDEQTEEEAARRQRAIEAGQRVVVGVNRFRAEDEAGSPGLPLFEYDPAWRDKQIARLRKVRAERDPALAEKARKRLAEAYREKANIIPPMVEAVKAYLSIGEIARVREEGLGEPPFRGAMYFWR